MYGRTSKSFYLFTKNTEIIFKIECKKQKLLKIQSILQKTFFSILPLCIFRKKILSGNLEDPVLNSSVILLAASSNLESHRFFSTFIFSAIPMILRTEVSRIDRCCMF